MAVHFKNKQSQFQQHLASPPAVKVVPAVGYKSTEKVMAKADAPHATVYEEEQLTSGDAIPTHRLASVHVEGARTINLGNYESARITVGITLPCDMDDVDEAYQLSEEWVSQKLEAATSTDLKKAA